MPVNANIAPNIQSTQTGNFSFDVVFSPPESMDIDDDSFTLSNIQVSGSTDVTISDLTLISFKNNTGVIVVVIPDEATGNFTVDLIGSVLVGSQSETITSIQKRIEYDTRDNIQATFGNILYNSDNSISIPVSFEDDVSSLSKTDFVLFHLAGDDISRLKFWLTGNNREYKIWFLPDKNTSGSFRLDIVGDVLLNYTVSQEISVTPIVVVYNNQDLEINWIIPKGKQRSEFTVIARFSKYITNTIADLENKIILFGAPKGTTVSISQINQREFKIEVDCPANAEIVPSFDLEEISTSQNPMPLLERLTSEYRLEENGQRQIEFTFIDGVPTLVGETGGIVKFYSAEDSTNTITNTPGSTGSLQSNSVVFSQDGTAVSTFTLNNVATTTTVYAEIEITINSVTYSTGRFRLTITT